MAKRSIHSEPVYTRTPIEAERGVCAGGHPAVADAGVRLMQEGGNAFDALIGAAFTAFVVEPAMCGLGGYARISAYSPSRRGVPELRRLRPRATRRDCGHVRTGRFTCSRRTTAIPSRWVIAPSADSFRSRGAGRSGGVLRLSTRCSAACRLPEVMAPAIEAAAKGIEIAWPDLLALAGVSRYFDAFPDTRAVWTPGGALP